MLFHGIEGDALRGLGRDKERARVLAREEACRHDLEQEERCEEKHAETIIVARR